MQRQNGTQGKTPMKEDNGENANNLVQIGSGDNSAIRPE
jgi:hypothetical protein